MEDAQSNVFHKAAVVYDSGGVCHPPGILTLGGSCVHTVKLWAARARSGSLGAEHTVDHAEFGGKHNRMREAETADLVGVTARTALAVATHDQGVVAP